MSFQEVFKGGLKHINSHYNENFVVVVVVCQSSQLPEQREGLLHIHRGAFKYYISILGGPGMGMLI